MRKKIGLLILLQAVLPYASASETTPWSVNNRVLDCPAKMHSALRVAVAPGAGHELALRRLADDTWFFLVVGSPPASYPQLMTLEALARRSRLEIPSSLRWPPWGSGTRPQQVFKPGWYELYISDNLESEAGGFKCRFKFTGMIPNNSFKPNPLRGSA